MAPVVGPLVREEGPRPAAAVPGGVRRLDPFRGHVATTGAGRTLRLACGRTDTVRARLARLPCPKGDGLRRVHAEALGEGALEDPIGKRSSAMSWVARLGKKVGPAVPPEPDR